jgi:glycosyltransferase involved in cell wall biosynthesis
VENRNVEQFAKAIETLATDEEMRKRYGLAAKQRVQALFTNEQFNKNINALIESL